MAPNATDTSVGAAPAAADVGKKNDSDRTTIVIDGEVYDITSFMKRHPGGSVIASYNGLDASDVYRALHFRSERADKTLRALPRAKDHSGADDATPGVQHAGLIADFRSLRQELVDDGLFEPNYVMNGLRFLELGVLYYVAATLLLSGWVVVGGIVEGYFIARCGLLMHEAGHRAFTGNVKNDQYLQTFIFTFLTSGSATYWNNQHNKHHACTQEVGHDTDLATMPVIAFNKMVAALSGGRKTHLKVQWLYFIPSQAGLFFFWKFSHTRHMIRTRNRLEIAAAVLHHIVEFYVMWNAGLVAILTWTAIGWCVGGAYLASVFSLNHTHKPAVEAFTRRNWVIRSTEHTTNTGSHPLVSYISGYLNFQIEHHLFPNMPHPNLPYAAGRVQALCEKHGVEYDVDTMKNAFFRVMNNLKDVGAYAASLDADGKPHAH